MIGMGAPLKSVRLVVATYIKASRPAEPFIEIENAMFQGQQLTSSFSRCLTRHVQSVQRDQTDRNMLTEYGMKTT